MGCKGGPFGVGSKPGSWLVFGGVYYLFWDV